MRGTYTCIYMYSHEIQFTHVKFNILCTKLAIKQRSGVYLYRLHPLNFPYLKDKQKSGGPLVSIK